MPGSAGCLYASPSLASRHTYRRHMTTKPKRPVGWGELNLALNALVKEGIIVSYSTGAGKAATSIDVQLTAGRTRPRSSAA